MNTTSNRRSFLTTLSVIAPVVCGVNRFTAAWAEDLKPGSLPALDESNPVANALGYRHDATKVDRLNSRSAQALREKSSFVTTVRSFKRGDFQSLASRGNSASARSSRKVSCM